jgi:hypothetical protein
LACGISANKLLNQIRKLRITNECKKIMMKLIDPDDKKQLSDFWQEWQSCYTERNPMKPPSLTSLRVMFQYGTYGSIPGDFITAIIQNDLNGAFAYCPTGEEDLIHGTLQYALIRLPVEAVGSPEKLTKWVEKMKKSKMFRPTDLY